MNITNPPPGYNFGYIQGMPFVLCLKVKGTQRGWDASNHRAVCPLSFSKGVQKTPCLCSL